MKKLGLARVFPILALVVAGSACGARTTPITTASAPTSWTIEVEESGAGKARHIGLRKTGNGFEWRDESNTWTAATALDAATVTQLEAMRWSELQRTRPVETVGGVTVQFRVTRPGSTLELWRMEGHLEPALERARRALVDVATSEASRRPVSTVPLKFPPFQHLCPEDARFVWMQTVSLPVPAELVAVEICTDGTWTRRDAARVVGRGTLDAAKLAELAQAFAKRPAREADCSLDVVPTRSTTVWGPGRWFILRADCMTPEEDVAIQRLLAAIAGP